MSNPLNPKKETRPFRAGYSSLLFCLHCKVPICYRQFLHPPPSGFRPSTTTISANTMLISEPGLHFVQCATAVLQQEKRSTESNGRRILLSPLIPQSSATIQALKHAGTSNRQLTDAKTQNWEARPRTKTLNPAEIHLSSTGTPIAPRVGENGEGRGLERGGEGLRSSPGTGRRGRARACAGTPSRPW